MVLFLCQPKRFAARDIVCDGDLIVLDFGFYNATQTLKGLLCCIAILASHIGLSTGYQSFDMNFSKIHLHR